jgi:membrane fusion protein (multidrug efflux system)
MMLPRSLLTITLGIALAGAGCQKKAAQGGGFGGMPPMPVETALVEQGPIADRFTAVGTIEAGDAITVVAEINAMVMSLPFHEGSAVSKGALLAQLDDAQLRAEVDRTRALLDQSKGSYERIKSVVDQGAGAPQDLDDAAAALHVAEANLALAEARLVKTRITAPWGGVVGARRVSPGAFLRAGDPITDLANLVEIRVNFSAPERYLSKLQRGADIEVSTTAYPGLVVNGTIDVVEPVLDPTTRSARIVAHVHNPEQRLRPGMSADVSAVMSVRESALTIPQEAVFVEGDLSYVFMVKPDSTVARTALQLGTRTKEKVEVLTGLEPGARVVRAGHQKLFDGAKVIPIQSQGQGQGAAPGAAGSTSSAEKP